MDASIGNASPFKVAGPGRFTKASVQTTAGELEARLSEAGNWELRIRRYQETCWRVACSGDLDGGSTTSQPVEQEILTRGVLTVDPDRRTAMVRNTSLKLRPKEFALLLALAARPDRVFTKRELLTTVWGYPADSQTRTVDYHAGRLRRKLSEAGAGGLVVNSWGVGYRLWDRPDLISLPGNSPTGEAA